MPEVVVQPAGATVTVEEPGTTLTVPVGAPVVEVDADGAVSVQPAPTTVVVEEPGATVVVAVGGPVVEVIAAGPQGPPGAEGPPGPPGSGGDLAYTHTQSAASATWTIDHNLGKFPSVALVDSLGREFVAEIEHVSANQVIAHLSAATAGKAYCN